MIKLSTGVEISEDTVISALKKAGISVEPKHIWCAGDVAYKNRIKIPDNWRLIVSVNGELLSVNYHGIVGAKSVYFGLNGYQYAGKQRDLLKG